MSAFVWPDWIDPIARALAETYAERIWDGDADALNEAVELAVQARDLRLLPEIESA